MINKSKLDEAFNAEIVRVSTLEYNAQAICTHFYAKLCERLATVDAPADTTTASIEPAAEVHQSIDALEAAQNAAYPIPDSPHQSVVQRAVDDREAYRRGWMDHLNASKDVASRGALRAKKTFRSAMSLLGTRAAAESTTALSQSARAATAWPHNSPKVR